MLVLSRQTGQRILVGDEVVITVVRISENAVRLGIDAPKNHNIVREELGPLRKIQANESDIADLGRVIDPLGVASAYEGE